MIESSMNLVSLCVHSEYGSIFYGASKCYLYIKNLIINIYKLSSQNSIIFLVIKPCRRRFDGTTYVVKIFPLYVLEHNKLR